MGRNSFVGKLGVWETFVVDSTPSEEWGIYFGLKLAYGESV